LAEKMQKANENWERRERESEEKYSGNVGPEWHIDMHDSSDTLLVEHSNGNLGMGD